MGLAYMAERPGTEPAPGSADEAMLAAAIADTEQEIFDEAINADEPINDGDTSLEQGEDFHGEPTDDAGETLEAEPDEGDGELGEDGPDDGIGEEDGSEPDGVSRETQRDERQGRGVPSYRLREQTERATRAEQEAAELRDRVARMEGQISAIQRPPQREPTQPTAPPDMFVDPEGWRRHQREQITNEVNRSFRNTYVDGDMARAHGEHGDAFKFAYDALVAEAQKDPNGEARRLVDHIMYRSATPASDVMKWAQPRLDAWHQQRENDAAQLLAEQWGVSVDDVMALRGNTGGNGRQAPRGGNREAMRGNNGQARSTGSRARMPDLNGAGGGRMGGERLDPRGMDGSEESVFSYAFEPAR